MGANATPAKGATITIDGTAIGELTDISCPEMSQEVIEVTTLADTAKRIIASGVDTWGDVTISGNYYNSNAGQTALLAAATDGALHAFIITLPDSGAETWSFNAIVSKLGGISAAKGGHLTFEATLSIDNAVTRTP